MLLFHRFSVNLDDLCKVATLVKRGGDRCNVRREAIRGDLDALRSGSGPQALDKGVRGGLVAAPKGEVQNQPGIPLNGHKAVGVADVLVVLLARQFVGFLLGHLAPDFIGLNVPYRDTHNQPSHDLLAALAGRVLLSFQGVWPIILMERVCLPPPHLKIGRSQRRRLSASAALSTLTGPRGALWLSASISI